MVEDRAVMLAIVPGKAFEASFQRIGTIAGAPDDGSNPPGRDYRILTLGEFSQKLFFREEESQGGKLSERPLDYRHVGVRPTPLKEAFEMASKGQVGLEIDLKKVPLRDSSMTAEDILLTP